MKYNAHSYQTRATEWIIDKPYSALFLDMGLGKSVITLTAIQRLISYGEVENTLVVAPKKVAETTWTDEASKWDHLCGLSVVKVIGTERQRIKALESEADIYVTSRDNITWLVNHYQGRIPFDTLVIDELTSFKTPKSLRFKAIRLIRPQLSRVIGLTGTPAPNGLVDLWAQMYCIDGGERLGKSVTRYRHTYFDEFVRNGIPLKTTLKKGAEAAIRGRIADICLSMQAKDYLTLPDLMIHDEYVTLSDKERKGYEEFERDMVLEFAEAHADERESIVATSAAALMNKLSQYANGAIYDEEHNAHEIHSEKLARLGEIVEAAGGESVLVFYQYKYDVYRITDSLKGKKVRVYESEKDLADWNAHKIDVLLAHPASTAYGLNMQQGGHYIVWFGTGWNLEYYQQANARLHRQGQSTTVIVYNLIVRGTVDERAAAAIRSKKSVQQSLLENLKNLSNKYCVSK